MNNASSNDIARRFRSGPLRDLFKEAVRQGFTQGFSHGNGHAYLLCTQCGVRISFSRSATGNGCDTRNKLAALRRHGLTWNGQPAEHTATNRKRIPTP